MPKFREAMTLTRELVATTQREVEDVPVPGRVLMSDLDYDLAVRGFLTHAHRPIWVFAYGSLLWKPAWDAPESYRAMVHGWHRTFCFRSPRFRGTIDRPGLMMALDRGGRCQGMIFKVDDPEEQNLGKLFRREMIAKPTVNLPRWLKAETNRGPVRAIGFVVNRKHDLYTGKLTLDEVADVLSKAAGHWGSCAEYLYETVTHLEGLGIHDQYLWRVQQLVAERILNNQTGRRDNNNGGEPA
jgi:glutathione-specific gamma-glutamylcyclotransferase